jgi:hypothetical protein
VSCHETADVREIHECATCHNATVDTSGTTACASTACHGSAYPVNDPDHYSLTKHAAVETGCNDCHSMDMKAEHSKSTVNVTCVQCHETKVDYFTAPWDKTCGACHPTKHDDKTVKHTALASPDCARCHDKDISVGVNVEPVHASAPQGECAVCHVSSTRVPDLTTKTAECASCHATSAVDYHRQMDAKHTFAGMDPSCVAAECHASSSLPDEHARFLGRYPSYTDTCALCHLNADSARIDWTTATADCSTCHTVHGDVDVIHQAPDSSACVSCHETADVREIHECATCHNTTVDTSGTTACASTACHGTKYPTPDPSHYDATKHAAAETTCGQCHFMDMKAEHFKSTVMVTCVQCHETKVDYFTTLWDKTCAACHATKHGNQSTAHNSSNTSCAGTGCHDITDVTKIHGALQGSGCYVCHKSASEPATTTNCTAIGCHADVGTDHHAAHDGSAVNGSGCEGCHFRHLDDEHAALGYTCSTCHASINATVQAAIQNNDVRCLSCHPDSAHNARQAVEFAAGAASMHRVNADYPGMRSSFVVNGTTYTMSLPTAGNFLKTDYTTSAMLTCGSCHAYSDAAGPHGATMKINIDPAYPGDWKLAYLEDSSSTGMRTSTNTTASNVICAKCHDLYGSSFSNNVHGEGDHHDSADGKCVNCHVKIPHGWGRPRLLGSVNDPLPYQLNSGGINTFRLRNYTPTNWDENDCYAACAGDHDSPVSPAWPVTTTTVGTVSGTVTDDSGIAVSGATVKINDLVATTGTSGAYSIGGVPTGSQSVTASKSGYVTQTKTAAVYDSKTTVVDFALVAGATYDNLALVGVASASDYKSGYEPAKAIDGDTSTRWSSNGKDTRWLKVDLGMVASVDKVVIAWYGDYYARSYKVQVSTDNSTWVDVYSTTSGSSGTKTHTFTATNARYVRVYCTYANKDYYSITEFQVWGAEAPKGVVSGQVTDSSTGSGLSGASVTITGGTSATTDSGGYYTLTSVPAGTTGITYAKSGYVSQTINVNVVADTTTTQNVALAKTNLALGKSFSASRYESSTYSPGKAGDGSLTSYWWSDNNGGKDQTDWLTVDLGTTFKVNSVEIAWYDTLWAVEYRVYTSKDNKTYSEAYKTTAGTSGTSVITFTARDARYVKVECRKTGTRANNGYGIAELRVFQ